MATKSQSLNTSIELWIWLACGPHNHVVPLNCLSPSLGVQVSVRIIYSLRLLVLSKLLLMLVLIHGINIVHCVEVVCVHGSHRLGILILCMHQSLKIPPLRLLCMQCHLECLLLRSGWRLCGSLRLLMIAFWSNLCLWLCLTLFPQQDLEKLISQCLLLG
jgi:hypothetical protein